MNENTFKSFGSSVIPEHPDKRANADAISEHEVAVPERAAQRPTRERRAARRIEERQRDAFGQCFDGRAIAHHDRSHTQAFRQRRERSAAGDVEPLHVEDRGQPTEPSAISGDECCRHELVGQPGWRLVRMKRQDAAHGEVLGTAALELVPRFLRRKFAQSTTVRIAAGVYSRCCQKRYVPSASGIGACSSWTSRVGA
jgi:hypothetical protein